MNHPIFKKTALTLLAILFLGNLFTSAQSLSGNVNSSLDAASLSYANVDVYKGDILVASVIADRYGNFNVKLDTGRYKCVINYAGHKSITKEMTVKGDEKADFDLAKDESSKYKDYIEEKEESSSGYYGADIVEGDSDLGEISIAESRAYGKRPSRDRAMKKGYSVAASMVPSSGTGRPSVHPGGIMPRNEASAGKLTAGEVNDFSKWDLWTDLKEGEFNQHSKNWEFNIQNRFMVQVTDMNGLPLADLKVSLVSSTGKEFYKARTDNTGKAELWESLTGEISDKRFKKVIKIQHAGRTHEIKKPKSIDKGINQIQIEADCHQSQKVDIAFVVDATGSMGDEISFLKAEMNDIMFQSKQISSALNFSFANVFYRDRGDAYITRKQDFTRVLSESSAFINSQGSGGGGDYEEAVEAGMEVAINELSWSEEARARIVFLILDAPPHNTPEIRAKMRLLTRQAADKGIRIVPIAASGANKSLEYLMRSMALGTNGTYTFLTNHSGIGGQHMEPSTDSYDVELLSGLMERIIKSYTYMPDCQQEIPELGLNYPDSSVIINPVDTSQVMDSTSDSTADSTSATIPTKPQEINWSYYPNPTRGVVNIKSSVEIKELYVSDLSGKVLQIVKDINPEKRVQVDLSSYASGIYLIRYPLGKQWVSGKVILIR